MLSRFVLRCSRRGPTPWSATRLSGFGGVSSTPQHGSLLNASLVKLTYIDSGGTTRTVEGEVGSTVMETAIKNSVPEIEAECCGACACATCHVYVEDGWKEKTGEPSPMEEDMLDFAFEVKPNSRLSCQIKVSDALEGLVVRTPERQA